MESIKLLLFNKDKLKESENKKSLQKQAVFIQSNLHQKQPQPYQTEEYSKKLRPSTPTKLKLKQILKPMIRQTKIEDFLDDSFKRKIQNKTIQSDKYSLQSKLFQNKLKEQQLVAQVNRKQKHTKDIPKIDKKKPITKLQINTNKFAFLKPQKMQPSKVIDDKKMRINETVENQQLKQSIKKVVNNRFEIKTEQLKIDKERQFIIDLTESSHETNKKQSHSSLKLIYEEQNISNEGQNSDITTLKHQNKSIIQPQIQTRKSYPSSSSYSSSVDLSLMQTEQTFPKIFIKGIQLKDDQKQFIVLQSNETIPKIYEQQYLLQNYVYQLIDFYERRTKLMFGVNPNKQEFDWL